MITIQIPGLIVQFNPLDPKAPVIIAWLTAILADIARKAGAVDYQI